MAQALWITGPGKAELREEALNPRRDELVVESRFGGISRGTEALVFRGGVPASEWGRMRVSRQGGEFPFPVKYGYAVVGEVASGPRDLFGHRVFVLHPHQDRFAVPPVMALPLPGR